MTRIREIITYIVEVLNKPILQSKKDRQGWDGTFMKYFDDRVQKSFVNYAVVVCTELSDMEFAISEIISANINSNDDSELMSYIENCGLEDMLLSYEAEGGEDSRSGNDVQLIARILKERYVMRCNDELLS